MNEAVHDEIELSIVMPCLNEAETLGTCLRKAFAFLATSRIRGEVVIADNGSADGSQRIAEAAGAKVVHVPIRGYGAALYFGCKAAAGRYIIMGDSDDSYDWSNLDAFVKRLRDGHDLVMGNRFAGEIRPGAMPWKNRYIGNPVLSGLGRLLFGCTLGDFHCGLRGFSKMAFTAMDLRTTGMEFASEIVIKASLLKLRTSEVPTILSPDGRSRPPHLRPWRDGWRHLRFMLLFSPNWLFLYPGLVLMIVSAICGGIILRGPVTVAGLRLDVDSLIYFAFFTMIGLQCILFSLLARMYGVHEGLYPASARFTHILKYITLERGLIAGSVFAIAGFALGVYSIVYWHSRSFGLMDFASLARAVIPAATGMTLGVELILFSLLFSTLQLSVRDYAV